LCEPGYETRFDLDIMLDKISCLISRPGMDFQGEQVCWQGELQTHRIKAMRS